LKTVHVIITLAVFVFLMARSGSVLAFDTTVPGLGETGFYFTETAIYRYFTDEDYVDGYEDGEQAEFLNRLNLRITNRDYVLGLRFDIDLNTINDEEYRLEKKFFQVNKPTYSFELGDYYYTLGRGLVLNIVKSFEDEGSEYQIEQTILGGRFTYQGQRISGTILAGLVEDCDTELDDTIGGGSATVRFLDQYTVGFNALGIKFNEDDERAEFEMFDQGAIASVSLDVPTLTEFASLYLECATVFLDAEVDSTYEDLEGWAVYLESVFYLGNWILQIEGKRYRDFRFPYHTPPLLEPEEIGVLSEQFVFETTDVAAVRTRLDYSVPDTGTVLYGVYSSIDDSPDDDLFYGKYQRYVNEYYLGIDSHLANDIHLMASGGYRYERSLPGSPSDFKGYTPHIFFLAKVPIADRQSIEVVANWKHFTEDSRVSPEPIDFSRQEYTLAYHYSPVFALIGSYEFYDDVRSQSFDPDNTFKKDFYSATLQVQPLQNLYFKVFYGATPGGVKCCSGVCKTFPPFEGIRAEVVFRF